MADRVVFVLGAGASRPSGCPLMNDFFVHMDNLFTDHDNDPSIPESSRQSYTRLRTFRRRAKVLSAIAPVSLNNLEHLLSFFSLGCQLGIENNITNESFSTLLDDLQSTISSVLLHRQAIVLKKLSEIRPQIEKLPHPEFFGFSPDRSYLDCIGPSGPPGYFELAHLCQGLLNKNIPVTIITFNYDLGVEIGLFLTGTSFSYSAKQSASENPDSVSVLKLHGSLNWEQGKRPEQSDTFFKDHLFALLGYKKDQPIGRSNHKEVKKINETEFRQIIQSPVIIPPDDSKYVHREQLKDIWNRAVQDLRCCRVCVFAGYSVPESDTFFRSMVPLSLCGSEVLDSIIIGDPLEPVRTKISNLIFSEKNSRPFVTNTNGFSEAISDLQKSVSNNSKTFKMPLTL